MLRDDMEKMHTDYDVGLEFLDDDEFDDAFDDDFDDDEEEIDLHATKNNHSVIGDLCGILGFTAIVGATLVLVVSFIVGFSRIFFYPFIESSDE